MHERSESMSDLLSLDGKVAIVTGAAAGLGRAEALALARSGANVVVNDLAASEASAALVDEIEDLGAKALFVPGDVAERATADAMLAAATDHFGGLHVVVNNAGVTRDRMLFNMSDDEWDAVIRIHLRGHFLLSRNAAAYWRAQSKDIGAPVYARLVNTSSEAGLTGSEGQPNYSAAKAGIAAFTVSTARALARLGVRANAICPRARTAMTAGVFGADAPEGGLDPLSVEHVAPLVAYLASPAADKINGQVFVAYGGMIALMAPPTVEQRFDATDSPGSGENAGPWSMGALDKSLGSYFSDRDPARTFACAEVLTLS
jgi:NAD(P)-dependent dehydrogenase (short-subunit alcohol dehydrogenase family)